MNDYIVNIDESNAARLLIEESHQRPVVVDFWADWCEPCKVLMPLLEKIAHEYQGAFLLAKVNADEQGMIPAIRGAQPADGDGGPERPAGGRLRRRAAGNRSAGNAGGYLPKPWDELLQRGQDAIARGEFAEALPPLRQAWDESGKRPDISLAYAHALIESLRLDEAEAVLGEIRLADQDAAYEQLVAQIDIKREAARSPEIEALEARLAANPADLDVRHQLAVQYTNSGHYRDAMEHLIGILQQDLNHGDGASKKLLLDSIATLGKGDPLAAEFSAKLYSLLYSATAGTR